MLPGFRLRAIKLPYRAQDMPRIGEQAQHPCAEDHTSFDRPTLVERIYKVAAPA